MKGVIFVVGFNIPGEYFSIANDELVSLSAELNCMIGDIYRRTSTMPLEKQQPIMKNLIDFKMREELLATSLESYADLVKEVREFNNHLEEAWA
jgi:hypothetical protein